MAGSLIVRVSETPHVGIVKPYDDKETGAVALTDEERVKAAGGLPELDLVKLLEGTTNEPRWRKDADKCADYYDGNQLDSETLDLMQTRGVPPLIINLIQPTVNTVLGMEARQRTDWQVTFDEPEYELVASAINKKLNDFERTTFADRACSNAYGGQVKAGLHWVEVSRNPNPLASSPYRCKDIHRREIWWDWAEDHPDDWRYLLRKRWQDADRLEKFFPNHAQLIRYCANQWSTYGRFAEDIFERTGLARSYDIERAFTVTENEWRDSERHRLVTFEIWYRVWVRGYIAMLNNGKRIPIDIENNPRHAQLVAAGVLKPMAAAYPVMRQAFFIGPHRVLDRASPLPHNGFPYTPFFGFREDLTRAPYGLIRSMISPQDEINARRSRLMALLGSRRAQMDSDALDENENTIGEVADEISRADAFIITNPKRLNRDKAVHIEDNNDLSAGQAQVLLESKSEIHQASGVFQEVAGQTKSTLSGIALDSLVQQGTTTLAEINDNFLQSRREVGEQAVAFIKADSRHPHHVGVGEGKARRKIFLNAVVTDDSGEEKTINAVDESDIRVILEDTPSSASYRQQQFQHLAELTKSLPPQLQAFVTDFVIESSDLPERKKMAQRIRRMMNIPEPGMEDDPNGGMSPELQAMKQQYEAVIQEITQKAQLAMDEAAKYKAAAADKDDANAVKKYEIDKRDALERERLAEQTRIEGAKLDMQAEQDFMASLEADAAEGKAAQDAKEDEKKAKALLKEVMAEVKPLLQKQEEKITKKLDAVKAKAAVKH